MQRPGRHRRAFIYQSTIPPPRTAAASGYAAHAGRPSPSERPEQGVADGRHPKADQVKREEPDGRPPDGRAVPVGAVESRSATVQTAMITRKRNVSRTRSGRSCRGTGLSARVSTSAGPLSFPCCITDRRSAAGAATATVHSTAPLPAVAVRCIGGLCGGRGFHQCHPLRRGAQRGSVPNVNGSRTLRPSCASVINRKSSPK